MINHWLRQTREGVRAWFDRRRWAFLDEATYAQHRQVRLAYNRYRSKSRRRGEILSLVHPAAAPYAYEYFVRWMHANFPEAWQHFDVRAWPLHPSDQSDYQSVAFWMKDVVSEADHADLVALEHRCVEHGTTVFGRPSLLDRLKRVSQANTLNQAGFRTPQVERVKIPDLRRRAETLDYPFILRDNQGHQQPVHIIRSAAKLLAPLPRFQQPVLSEWIDTSLGQPARFHLQAGARIPQVPRGRRALWL